MMGLKDYINIESSPFQQSICNLDDFSKIILGSGRPFFVYGASTMTEPLLDRMLELNILPRCLCDSNENKHRTKMFMLQVLSPEDAVKDHPNAICAIGIRAIATCYEEIFARLKTAGCSDYYIIDWDLCHHIVLDEWKKDLRCNIDAVVDCVDCFKDTLSKKRYNEFILSYLSGKVDIHGCLGSFKSKDGFPLKNNLFEIGSNDTLLSCRCGLDRENVTFLNHVKSAKKAHLLEPTLSGRVITSALLSKSEENIFLYPFFPGTAKNTVDFEERHCFVKYIDLEDFISAKAPPIAFDAFADINATAIYLDMTGFHLDALKSAEKTISSNHPTLIITGFRLPSEVPKLISSYPNYNWHMRYFGGQNMREGYALIAYT